MRASRNLKGRVRVGRKNGGIVNAQLQGHVRNGLVVFDNGFPLPEGAIVRVEPTGEFRESPPVQRDDDEAAAARVVRIAWMRRMRLDEEEIEESLRDDPPTSVAEEMREIKALDNLDKITPTDAILGKNAIKYT